MVMAEHITLDTGALIALEEGERKFKALWHCIFTDSEDVSVTVPAAVLAEWWRPGVAFGQRILDAVDVEPVTEELAKVADVPVRPALRAQAR
jgi:hypothetical protein